MKTRHLLPVSIAAFLLFVSGCATLDPNADALVVRAEQSAEISFVTVDTFLTFELNTRTAMKGKLKPIADKFREKYPTALFALRSATKTYKAAKTSGNKDALSLAIIAVEAFAVQAQNYIALVKEETK